VGQGLLIHEVNTSHTTTHHSRFILNNQPDALINQT